jgi:hypothetical protein
MDDTLLKYPDLHNYPFYPSPCNNSNDKNNQIIVNNTSNKNKDDKGVNSNEKALVVYRGDTSLTSTLNRKIVNIKNELVYGPTLRYLPHFASLALTRPQALGDGYVFGIFSGGMIMTAGIGASLLFPVSSVYILAFPVQCAWQLFKIAFNLELWNCCVAPLFDFGMRKMGYHRFSMVKVDQKHVKNFLLVAFGNITSVILVPYFVSDLLSKKVNDSSSFKRACSKFYAKVKGYANYVWKRFQAPKKPKEELTCGWVVMKDENYTNSRKNSNYIDYYPNNTICERQDETDNDFVLVDSKK